MDQSRASSGLPLAGVRVAVTAGRKAEEQAALFERRGAEVLRAPLLTPTLAADDDELRASTRAVIERPPAVVLATTGIGLRRWFAAAAGWGLAEDLLAALGAAEIVARGPKTVGALRQHGLREAWTAPSEELAEMLDHLAGRDLRGVRMVVQEYGQSVPEAVAGLLARGADVETVEVYRVRGRGHDVEARDLVARVARGDLHAVTFTSAPAVLVLMQAAHEAGRLADVVAALASTTLAVCVGPVTAAAFEEWDVPTVHPERSRLVAMVRCAEEHLTASAAATSVTAGALRGGVR